MTDLADNLRAYTGPDGTKLDVVEVDGWESRTYDGAGLSGVAGALWHHTATASASSYTEGAPTLNSCTYGRSDLPGPLCNIVFGRAGEVYVVAAGQANHAGGGSIDGAYENAGNYWLIGVEMESSGTSDDWTAAQRALAPHLGAALDLAYSGGGTFYQVGHKEYSYEGKIDPAYWDMDSFREEINTLLGGGSITASVANTAAEIITENMEEIMALFNTKEEFAAAVKTAVKDAIREEFTAGQAGVKSAGVGFTAVQDAAAPAREVLALLTPGKENVKHQGAVDAKLDVIKAAVND